MRRPLLLLLLLLEVVVDVQMATGAIGVVATWGEEGDEEVDEAEGEPVGGKEVRT